MPIKLTEEPHTQNGKTDARGSIVASRPERKPAAQQNPFEAQRKLVQENLSGVGKVIAVHSGKGGVGKSMFAVNLAATLAKKGFKAGLVDADVDCPSCHKMLGKTERVFADERQRLKPLESCGIKVLSVGNMVESEDSANIMRGPIMFKLISEMLYKADWGKLDYLIIDLPPGTGDNPLTIMQICPLYGLIIVTQPQEVALVDARKSADMSKRMNVPVIGIVENMSGDVFGTGGAESTAQKLEMNFLGSIPLQKNIRELSDKGVPPVLEDAALYKKFAEIIQEAAI